MTEHKNKNTIKTKTDSFFSKHYQWILVVCILIVPLITTIYKQYMLTHKIETGKAVITKKYILKRINRGWYQMDYLYTIQKKNYSSTETISEKTYNNIKVGDTINIIINVSNPKISRWSEQNIFLK